MFKKEKTNTKTLHTKPQTVLSEATWNCCGTKVSWQFAAWKSLFGRGGLHGGEIGIREHLMTADQSACRRLGNNGMHYKTGRKRWQFDYKSPSCTILPKWKVRSAIQTALYKPSIRRYSMWERVSLAHSHTVGQETLLGAVKGSEECFQLPNRSAGVLFNILILKQQRSVMHIFKCTFLIFYIMLLFNKLFTPCLSDEASCGL